MCRIDGKRLTKRNKGITFCILPPVKRKADCYSQDLPVQQFDNHLLIRSYFIMDCMIRIEDNA